MIYIIIDDSITDEEVKRIKLEFKQTLQNWKENKSIFHSKLHILHQELIKSKEIDFKDKELVFNMCKNNGFDIPFVNFCLRSKFS